MSNLIVVVFEGRHTADEALLRLSKMELDWEVDLYDVVVMTRDKDGKVRISNSGDVTAGGYVAGSMVGGATGLLLGAMAANPAAGLIMGVAAGAGLGTIAGALDSEDQEDALAARIGSKLKPDTSALGMIGWTNRPTKVLNELEGLKGEVIETSLSVSDEKALREVLEKA